LDARGGVNSILGVHGWPACLRGWGNQRYIDDWTFQKLDPPVTDELRLGGVPLLISKQPSKFVAQPGERVGYTISIYNPSDTPVDAHAPVPLTDDLAGTLDDASFND